MRPCNFEPLLCMIAGISEAHCYFRVGGLGPSLPRVVLARTDLRDGFGDHHGDTRETKVERLMERRKKLVYEEMKSRDWCMGA